MKSTNDKESTYSEKIYPFTWNSITDIATFKGHENGAHENGVHENSEEMIQRDLPESNGEFVHQVLATLHWKKTLFIYGAKQNLFSYMYGVLYGSIWVWNYFNGVSWLSRLFASN